ncbi:MAG: sigma-70 family RNA polymerase sigma factor [Bacteroidaceae bacterium]|nr:sigma-70 family RNA polymerase sigma factor [Bacteroidaceae bacterium]MBQ9295471.1 sigma-70 family RNA polymerase sigma factor [Bacteroidaceae bacterium]
MKTDKQIAEAVRSGRREGQDLMVSRYGQEVFAMVARQVPGTMDAEELTQDTFLKAFAAIDSYDSQRASLGTWLCRIAYRLTLDFLKRRRQFTVSIEDTEVRQTDISDEQLEAELSTGNEERIQRLELLIDNLPPDERLLLTLHYFESRTLEECSFIMDATPHALANRLYRIRKKLYKQLISNYENT